MNRTYDNHVTALRLRRRASLTVSLVIPILTIAWLASAGVARAAGAPDTCTQGPNAGRAKAAVNAGITAANSLQTNASHLITITAARNIWGWQDGGRLVAGVDTLQQELDALAAITPTGTGSTQAVPVHFATVPGFTPNTGSYPAGSTSGNIYPSFALLSCFRNAYGSEVGMDYGAVYPNSLAGETTAQLKQNTCDTEQAFINHGFYRSWGAFAYANGQASSTAQSVIASCFGFGRVYGSGINSVSTLVNAPYTLHTLSLNGGSCSQNGLACSVGVPADVRDAGNDHERARPGSPGVELDPVLPPGDRIPADRQPDLGLHQLEPRVPLDESRRVLLRERSQARSLQRALAAGRGQLPVRRSGFGCRDHGPREAERGHVTCRPAP